MRDVQAGTSATGQPVRFTPFVVHSTGLVEYEVRLHVGTNVLAGSPFQLSLGSALFLVVLTPREARLFRRFQARPCAVRMAFRSAGRGVHEIRLRAALERLDVLSAANHTFLAAFSLAACPPEMGAILARCVERLSELRQLYESLGGLYIDLTGGYAVGEGVSALAELASGRAHSAVRVRSVAVDGLVVDLPGGWSPAPGSTCAVGVHAPGSSFRVNATVSSVGDVHPDGSRPAELSAEFTPELVDAVDRLLSRGTAPAHRTSA